MANEMVFTVEGAAATPAMGISLAEAGLKEREHLQEWVLQHPRVLGDDVKIVAFEFGRWSGTGSSVERDRLDILGLDTEVNSSSWSSSVTKHPKRSTCRHSSTPPLSPASPGRTSTR